MVTIGCGSGLISWWRSWPQFDGKSAPIAGRSGHDRAMIGGSIVLLMLHRTPSDEVGRIDHLIPR